jgi:hypothetical protein
LHSDIPYTIAGGTRVQRAGGNARGISALVLDRGSRTVRAESLARLIGAGVDEVLTVLGPSPHYDVEQLTQKLPTARFLLLQQSASIGAQINTGMYESQGPLVLVIWSDCEVAAVTDTTLERIRGMRAICGVPTVRGDKGSVVPTVTAPAFFGTRFRTVPVQPGNTDNTLYPFDFMGIYDRDRFTQSGGFDRRMTNPYWQLLDFGLRSYLWGERIAVVPGLRIDATRPLPAVDTTPDASYARFYVKNLAVRFSGDSGRLPGRKAVSFVTRSGLGPLAALRLFREIREWVRVNRYRFCQDARRVTELWEVDE